MGDKIIKRIIALVLDRDQAKRTEQDAQKALKQGTDPKQAQRNLSTVESGFAKLRSAAMKLVPAIAAAFALNKIRAFGQEAVAAAQEVMKGQRALDVQLRNVGVSWENVRGEIKQTADALWDTHRLTGGEIDQVLRNLVTVTGNYEQSIRSVGLAADVAAAFQMDQAAAAKLVGRVLNGDTAILKRYGIQVHEGADAVAVLTERVNGMAKANTTGTEALAKAWGDLKEEIGLAMIEAGGGTSVLDTLTGTVRGLTRWISENQEGLQRWVGGGISIATGAVKMFAGGVQDVADLISGALLWAFGQASRGLAFLADGFALATQAKAKFYGLFSGKAAAQAQAEAESLRQRAQALRNYADAANEAAAAAIGDVRARHQRDRQGRGGAGGSTRAGVGPIGAAGTIAGNAAAAGAGAAGGKAAETFLESFAARLEQLAPQLATGTGLPAVNAALVANTHTAANEAAAAWMDANWSIHNAAQNAAWDITNTWSEAFSLLIEGGATMAETVGGFLQGMAAAGTNAFRGFASEQIAKEIASAWSAFALAKTHTAYGNLPMAAIASDAARTHLLSAAKWTVVAGAAGAVGGALAGGGGGGRGGYSAPTSARDGGLRTAQNAERAAPETHIYIDGFNPRNPAHQRLVYQGMQAATERHGNITVHPR